MRQRIFFLVAGCVLLLLTASCQKTISGNGVVMDKVTQMPLKGVTINAYLEHPSPDNFQMTTQTDKNGAYFVSSDPQVCTGSCPDLYVEIVFSGYESQYVKNPHNDTTYLVPAGISR